MKVKIKKFHPDAVIPFKKYESDFCYDLVATSCEEVAKNVYKYGFGFGLQIDRRGEIGIEDTRLSIDIRPRSSVWNTGMVLSNCAGTVDEGYTNEISAVFYHVMTDMPRYKVGDKIAQMKIGGTPNIQFIEVDRLDDTERGLNGYGSTDKTQEK
jgi:dUTP pyrophosphatase